MVMDTDRGKSQTVKGEEKWCWGWGHSSEQVVQDKPCGGGLREMRE